MGLTEALKFAAFLRSRLLRGAIVPIKWTFKAAGRRWVLMGNVKEAPPED